MGAVFVCYRRGDSEGQARALVATLEKYVGKDSVFMDVDNLAVGRDFREELDKRLQTVDVMLVLIGHAWLDARNDAGSRRLDDPQDYVRREIAAALHRNITVTPVLLQGAELPSPERLPDDIRNLAYRNGVELGHSRWDSDVENMVARLGLKRSSNTSRFLAAALVGAVVVIGLWAISVQFQVFPTRDSATDGQAELTATKVETPPKSAEPQKPADGQPAPKFRMSPLEPNTNRNANDLFPNPILARSPDECSTLCLNNVDCFAMTYVPRAEDQNRTGNCWIKHTPGTPTPAPSWFSAEKVYVP